MLRIGGHYHARLGREPERQCCQRGVPVRIGASTPAIGGLFAAPDKRSDAHACIDHDFLLTPCSQDIMAKTALPLLLFTPTAALRWSTVPSISLCTRRPNMLLPMPAG